MKTRIEQIFRAVVFIRGSVDTSSPARSAMSCEAATELMRDFEQEAESIANQHSVEFQSLNTQLLWDGAFKLWSPVRENLEKAVKDIEALTRGSKRLRVVEN